MSTFSTRFAFLIISCIFPSSSHSHLEQKIQIGANQYDSNELKVNLAKLISRAWIVKMPSRKDMWRTKWKMFLFMVANYKVTHISSMISMVQYKQTEVPPSPTYKLGRIVKMLSWKDILRFWRKLKRTFSGFSESISKVSRWGTFFRFLPNLVIFFKLFQILQNYRKCSPAKNFGEWIQKYLKKVRFKLHRIPRMSFREDTVVIEILLLVISLNSYRIVRSLIPRRQCTDHCKLGAWLLPLAH